MIAYVAVDRHRLCQLVDRRAQGRSTRIGPIALYSSSMIHLGGDRRGQPRLLGAANLRIGAHLCRRRTSHRPDPVASDRFKIHSRKSLTGRGFVQQVLSGIRPRPAFKVR